MHMHSPGKYDDLCTHARETAQAEGAIVFIANGKHGNGFSVQGTARFLATLPGILEALAESIREDLQAEDDQNKTALLNLGRAAGCLDRDDLRRYLIDALANGRLKREHITKLRDRCNEVLAASEANS